ncbi:hypothetical protein SDC9_154917 [bioreactor metagenome]|uniref:Uncharacterized protein n=1 Tax=bioreactor metagenome TaxID=1076179 RepID=A0A645F1W2_9ZZZZ
MSSRGACSRPARRVQRGAGGRRCRTCWCAFRRHRRPGPCSDAERRRRESCSGRCAARQTRCSKAPATSAPQARAAQCHRQKNQGIAENAWLSTPAPVWPEPPQVPWQQRGSTPAPAASRAFRNWKADWPGHWSQSARAPAGGRWKEGGKRRWRRRRRSPCACEASSFCSWQSFDCEFSR